MYMAYGRKLSFFDFVQKREGLPKSLWTHELKVLKFRVDWYEFFLISYDNNDFTNVYTFTIFTCINFELKLLENFSEHIGV